MKKIISILTILTLFLMLIFSNVSFGAALDTINIEASKQTVRPDEIVTLNVDFGKPLAAYTINASYDNNIFDYVEAQGGEANNTGNKVIVTFHDATGGSSQRDNMNIKFRAKADITTSNPTEITFTLNGLGSVEGGTTVSYDDITTPIVKNLTVEPEYVNYTIKLDHTGEIVKQEEIPMTLSYSSPMGRYYEHARLVAQATTPNDGEVRLMATDTAGLEYDIIDSGWGDAQGYKIGGKNVSQTLQTKAIFSKAGDYKITLKLIDRDNSDSIIAEKVFSFSVLDEHTPVPPTETETENTPPKEEVKEENTKVETPKKLPKTGSNIYISAGIILVALAGLYIYYNQKTKY